MHDPVRPFSGCQRGDLTLLSRDSSSVGGSVMMVKKVVCVIGDFRGKAVTANSRKGLEGVRERHE